MTGRTSDPQQTPRSQPPSPSDAELQRAETVSFPLPSRSASGEEARFHVDSRVRPEPAEGGPRRGGTTHPGHNGGMETAPSRVGQAIGSYRILSEIARGGMGIVYLAEQETLKRTVALKVLRAGEGASEEDCSRFLREAEAAASLAHPSIVPIHDLAVHEGQPFFTMDYIEGPSLERLITEGRLTIRQAVEYLEQIAHAIDYAHARGIVHRDLKPANVIIAPNNVPMITDFGLAVNLGRHSHSRRMTHSGVVMGTIPYIPPEQAAGDVERVGPASDIYSMGAILYECITGQPPFEGETQFELLHCVIHRDPVPPRRLNPKISPDLQTICLKCLEKPIGRRYRTARELAEDCRAFLNGEMIRARPATSGYRTYRWLARHRTLALLAGCLILLGATFLTVAVMLQSEKEEAVKELAKSEVEKTQTTRELRRVEAEKDELAASLHRGWRQVLDDSFPTGRLGTQWITLAGTAEFQRGYLALRSDELPPDAPVNVGLRDSYPGDCRIECKVYVPKVDGGAIGILLSGQDYKRSGNVGYTFRIGPPSAPGARIDKGPAALVNVPGAILEPDLWHNLRVLRNDTSLALYVDDLLVASAVDETLLRGDENCRIGFFVQSGAAYLDDIRVFRPGMSPQMLVNMLDLADDFYRAEQIDWTLQMAEYVLRETGDTALHLRAARRCLSAYQRRFRTSAEQQVPRLIRMIEENPNYDLFPGEEPYLYGLLAVEARDYERAARHFDAAAATAVSADQNRFVLLGRLRAILSRIRGDRVAEAVELLTRMQRDDALRQIAEQCKADLQAGDTHAVFLAEVDRLLAARQLDSVWSFLEALRVLFPEGGRDLATRCLALAQLYREEGRFEEAQNRIEAARLIHPQWEEPRLGLAALFAETRRETEALTLLQQTAEAFPQSLAARTALARFLLDSETLRDPARALAAAQRAVEITDRRDPAALDLLARAQIATGDRPQAYQTLKAANELNPTPERLQLMDTLLPGSRAPAAAGTEKGASPLLPAPAFNPVAPANP